MKTVVICGGGPSKVSAPTFMKDGIDIWSVGVACPELHQIAHTVFEMHTYDNFKKLGNNMMYVQDLKKVPGRLMMLQAHTAFPTSATYPIDEITAKYGRYFTSTISYMIALAIHEGYKQIILIGVELDKAIYHVQRASIEFFIGLAWGSGVVVTFPDTLPFLKTERLYGYEE